MVDALGSAGVQAVPGPVLSKSYDYLHSTCLSTLLLCCGGEQGATSLCHEQCSAVLSTKGAEIEFVLLAVFIAVPHALSSALATMTSQTGDL